MGYQETDWARFGSETPKSASRGPFARDRARVLHSSALRRLSDKTQVLGPGGDDFSRNRLTHSLEVAQVGRDLAAMLGCDPDVVDAACLAHDLGHPPFGHNGEVALNDITDDIGGFEGNAQTLRLLTYLEPKISSPETGKSLGLNLTRATLDAATKYPWQRGENPSEPGKFGVYAADLEIFNWFRSGAMPGRRCIEAQVMDLSDDIAYSVHDVEDAIVGGWVDPSLLREPDQQQRIADRVRDWYLPDAQDHEVGGTLDSLAEQEWWITTFDPTRIGLAALKNTTSQLIGRFIVAVVDATRAEVGTDEPITRYTGDIVLPRQTRLEINVLKAVASVFVMTADGRRSEYRAQRRIITNLVEVLWHGSEQGALMLEPPFQADYEQAETEADKRRSIVDQVASLTDVRALAWAREFGI